MPIQDDFTVDVVDRKITYSTAFVDDRPPTIYTVNELYSYLQDLFDEPNFLQYTVPMSAQTPTQYTLINGWFMDPESMKALYGGSIQTSDWLYNAGNQEGITALRWQDAPTNPPDDGELGATLTGGTSGATGVMLYIDTARQVVYVRNTNGNQFQDGENVTGTDTDFNTMATRGFQSGESIWSNLFSVGSLQANTEIYIGQEDDYLGGTAFHDADADSRFERRREKIEEWWDSDVDFATGSPNLLGGAGHFDVLVLTQELGVAVDGQRLGVFARQFSTVYSHFELVGGVGNFVVPFSSTGSDLNSQDGPYEVGFDAGAGGKGQLDVGDVLENDTGTTPVGRLRAVVTAVTGTTSGSFEYYLIGENEADGTLRQFADNENIAVRGDAFTFDIDAVGTPVANVGPGLAQGITVTFGINQIDVDEVGGVENYGCTINCNNVSLAEVYKRVQFLTARGNQDGTAAGTPDTLLPSGNVSLDEGGEFYRGVGDIFFNFDGGTGTQPTTGDLVTNGSGAYGVVVAVSAGTTGVCVLTQVKGTFADNDVVAEIDAAGGNSITVQGTPETIVQNTAAPFGTFAGGRWFLARGVVLTNVPAADANNWETADLGGTRRVPPAVRAITFSGLQAGDRAALFEVATAGGRDIVKNQNGVGAGGAAVSDTSIPLDATVALDVPPDGWVRVLDASSVDGQEYRYEYSSVAGTTVTLRTGAGLTGTAEAGGSATVLVDTGAFANFGTDGNVKIGHMIRNVASGEWAEVVRQIDNDSIETTPLTGAGTWATGNGWEANQIVVALVDADDVYFPFIDGVAAGTNLNSTIKYVADTECIARMRFSSPDISASRILPFEQTGITITDADLTVTAIRNTDPIAA